MITTIQRMTGQLHDTGKGNGMYDIGISSVIYGVGWARGI